MTQYSSIRIYIKSSIINNSGFFDVIGYYGNTPTTSNGIVLIDVSNECYPLVKSNDKYYYLAYSDEGYIPNDTIDDTKIHPLLDTSVERIIYQDKVGDFNQVERGYSINLNISIVNINSQVAAWRTYTMDVYDTYAIRKFGSTIHDDHNLIDDGNQDIILVETNPDNYIFDPTGGTVPYLETFTVECNREIFEIKQETSQGARICIYEKETKSIVQSVNLTSILKTGSSLFTFGLNGKITYSGIYFLYLPSEIITFSNGSSSPMVLIGYTIPKSESDDDIHAFECQTRGKILSTLNISFYNVGSYNVAINQTLTINVTSSGFQGLNINTRDSSRVYKSDNLTVTIDLGMLIINNTSESKFYNIHIPSGTFYLSDLDSNNAIDISFELVPQDAELPVNGNYVIKFTPAHGSKLIKLDLFKISFCLDKYLDYKSSSVTYSGTPFSIKNLSLQTWSTGLVNLGRTIEYDLGYKMFSYTFRLTNPIDELGNYTITIPADSFSLDSGFNSKLLCNYDILEFVEEDEQSSDTYLYDMLKIVPNGNYDSTISFKKDNTIFVNSTKLESILLSPIISLVDYRNSDKLTGNIFSFNDYRDSVLEMYCNLRALLSSGEWVYDEASYNSLDLGKSTPGFAYGLDIYDLRQFYKLYNLNISGQETDGLFFKNKIINELPRSMFLKLEIKLDGNYVAIETNILFLEDSVYKEYKNNVNWVLEKLIDIYSGEECAHVYVTPNKTNIYDSVVKELVYDPDNDEYKNRCVVELESVTKVRLGNLNNIYNETFKDKQPHGFGLYGLNVFLTGNFYLNNGRSMLDIDNDITMAVGNVNAVKQSLDNLGKQLQQTSELLDLKVSNAERGVSSTISNFISTNRDAIFKLGLDYSMWSLGSAGISLYNPNVKYKYDEYGNKVVDETTVGDFDEGILIQADKLRINNYYSTTVGGVTYYKVIVTSANPKDWIYPNQDEYGLFYPRMRDDTNSDRPRTVPFKYFYIRQDLINKAVLCSTLGCEDGSILRYVYIQEDDLGNPYCPEPGNLSENFTSYAFNSFYSAYTQSSNSNERITFYIIENNVVTSAQVNDLVWFLPYTIQAALFNNGKIYAKYISTEGLEVEHLIAIPKDLSPWELAGSRNVRKNPDFDISKPITESNYPVICDSIYKFEGNNQYASQPEKTVPFVVISGYTGKITARSADIYGSITVGDRTGTNSKYIVLSDNIDDNAVESGRTPAMYIMSNDNGYPRVIAKFSGDDEGNLLNRYTNLEEDDTSSESSYQIPISIQQNTYGLGELTTIPNKSESNDITTLGYPMYSENNSFVYNLICTIPSSDKMRNLRFNITPPTKDSSYGLNLNNSGSMTFKSSLVNQGKIYGFITYNVDYFIKQGTTMDTNGTKIGSMLMRVFVNDRTSGMSYSNLVPTLLNNIVVNPSESDYIVYYRCWVDMNCYLMYRYLSYDANKFPLKIDYYLQGINISITPSGLNYFSQYTGNGMSSGYNKDNYFGSYYRMDSNGYPGMITGFRSGGIGMLFDRTNPYYLFPNNFMIPMYIPIVYFRGGPYEDTQLLLPSTNPESCYLTVYWQRDTNYDSIYNAYQEYNDSDLINFYAMRGNRTYTYESTYSDGTPRERSGNTIEINADAVYEFCYYKLDKLLHDNYGIGISTKNVRVNLTRLWGSISGITSYYNNGYHTNQEDTGNHVKVDVITGRTVYISTFLPNFDHLIDDLRFNFLGSIEIYLNPNNSSGQTIDTNYTQELMTYKREKWNEIYTGFYNRYIALTAEQQQLLNLNTMLQSFNTNLLTLNSTSVKETVDSTELNLSNLTPLIKSVLSDIENGSGPGDDSSTSVTPPSTSPSSDNTDDLYSVNGNGYHNNTSGAVSADGTSSIPVGKITNIDSSLSGVTPTVWAVYDIEGSNIINKSNVTLDPDNSEYIIKAIVNANSTTSIRKARIFVTFDGGNHYGYVNVYQAAGSSSSTGDYTGDANLSTAPDEVNKSGNFTASGTYNNAGGGLSADSSTNETLGTITLINTSLGAPTIYGIYNASDSPSSMLKLSDLYIDPLGNNTYLIKARNVLTNNTTSIRHVKVGFEWSSSIQGYVNVFLKAGPGNSSDDGSTPSGDADVDEYLNTFKSSSLASTTLGDSKYSLLSTAMDKLDSFESNIMSDNMFVDDVYTLPSGNSVDTRNARRGWFMALLLTALYPIKNSAANNDILKDAMLTWGIGTWNSNRSTAVAAIDSYNVSTYEAKYKGLLQGSAAFSYLFSDSNFVNSFSSFTSYSYQGSDGDLGLTSRINAPAGQYFFPYPLTNNINATSGLMKRDEDAFKLGQTLRSTSRGTIAVYDESLKLEYWLDILQTATGKNYSSGSAYTFLYDTLWDGKRTVNNIKNADGFWRNRPAWENNDTSVDSDTYPLNFGEASGKTGSTSDTTSYPSAHAGYFWNTTYCFAAIGGLSNSAIVNLFKRAYQYSESRVIVGAHWQMCVEMGRIAAACSFATLCGNAKFIELLQLAQA